MAAGASIVTEPFPSRAAAMAAEKAAIKRERPLHNLQFADRAPRELITISPEATARIRKNLRRTANGYERARAARDDAIAEVARNGMSLRAIAAEVGLVFQRVQQIVKERTDRG